MKYTHANWVIGVLLLISTQAYSQSMEKIIEVRTYNLKPGKREAFHQLVVEQALPMLKRWKIDVVTYGKSIHDENTYFLARGYTSVEHMNQSEDAFYGSEEWRKGPREAVLALIENYTTLVMPAGFLDPKEDTLTRADDLKKLSALNAQFIKNFITEDTASHAKILHKDFVCIENAGVIAGREDYLNDWAHAYRDSNYISFTYSDEVIRIFGNTALVRSKTTSAKIVNGKEVRGHTIYTDTYVKEDGKWLCVQAHITPVL
jgi:ketosteroid isomerase-like protein